MNLAKQSLNARSLATYGFGVILAGFSAAPAQALVVNAGTDYLRTPSGSSYNFTLGGLPITFPVIGLRIGTPTITAPDGGFSGVADTVVNRLDTVTTPGTTNINVVGLSLRNESPVSLPGLGLADIFIGLDPANASDGIISYLNDSQFTAEFNIRPTVVIAPAGTLIPSGSNFIKNLISSCNGASYTCLSPGTDKLIGSGKWESTPSLGQFEGPNLVNASLPTNFYILSPFILNGGGNKSHGITPVPGPLPILGIGAAFSFSRRLRKKLRTAAKAE